MSRKLIDIKECLKKKRIEIIKYIALRNVPISGEFSSDGNARELPTEKISDGGVATGKKSTRKLSKTSVTAKKTFH